MSAKFKLKDVVYYMESSTPKKATVTGIATVVGEIKLNTYGDNAVGTEEEPTVLYNVGSYSVLKEKELFPTKEDLQLSLFKNIE